ATAQQEIQSGEGELAATREALAGTTRERDRLAAEAADLAARLATASRERDAAREALARAETEAASMQRALSGAQDELASARQSLGMTREEIAERERKLKEAIAAYDRLVNDLKQEISEGEVQISRLRDRLTVTVLDRILFDSGSARIKPGGEAVLRKVADTVRTLTDQEVHIEGHTDNVPIKATYRHVFPTNWELSTARATGVARFLQEQTAVDPTRLAAVGYGEYRPVQPNESEEGRAQNRRIEIVLVPRDAETALR
ncbi:MAG TPA: OmpA family protein, partial [Thermodesulfobacteriota bacterium]